MKTIRIGAKRQVTLPREALEELDLHPGDLVQVQVGNGSLNLVPDKTVPRDQAWFWSEEWQAKEREADEAIAHGDISGPFQTAEEVVRHLRGG